MNKWLISLIILLANVPALADTRYVIDELIITVRSGPSNQHQIVKLIHSGAKLDVIEEVESQGRRYARIQAKEMDGWVLSQYLSPEPIARDRLETAQRQNKKYHEENLQLKRQLTELQQLQHNMEKQRDRLQERTNNLSQQLERLKRVSARPLEIEKNNEQLRSELSNRINEVKQLSEENARLKSRDQREWFITGGGVVLSSILIGILLIRVRWQRRSIWAGGAL